MMMRVFILVALMMLGLSNAANAQIVEPPKQPAQATPPPSVSQFLEQRQQQLNKTQDPANYTTPVVAAEPQDAAKDVVDEAIPVKLSCPAELRNQVLASGLNLGGWSVGGAEQSAPLKGARLFKGIVSTTLTDRNPELTAIPYLDRKTSEFRQVWSFEPAALLSGIVLVCDYSGTTQYLMHAVPTDMKECREINVLDQQDKDKNGTRVLCR